MPEVKRALMVDNINVPKPEDLPPLPEMEFEGEKSRQLHLTLLKWDHPFLRKPKKLVRVTLGAKDALSDLFTFLVTI